MVSLYKRQPVYFYGLWVASRLAIRVATLALCALVALGMRQAWGQCSSCTSTITMPSAANVTVASGQTVCFSGIGSFTGTVTMSGGTVCIGASVTYNPSSASYASGSTILNFGAFSNVSGLNFNTSTLSFYNYISGSVAFSSTVTLNSSSLFYSVGTLSLTSLTIGSTGRATLGGTPTISGTITNGGLLNIAGRVVAGTNVTNSGGTILGGVNAGCNYLDATNTFSNTGTIGGSGQALLLGSNPGGTINSPATTTGANSPSNSIASPSLVVSGNDIVGTITNPGGGTPPTNYIVMRRLNNAVDNASRPVDYTTYTIGQTVGNSVVVAINPISQLTFTDVNALSNGCQQYNYACFGYTATSGGCANYRTTINNASITTTTNAGTVSGGTSICSGSTSGLLTLSGYAGTIVKWQSAVSPFSTWTDIANTAATYTSGALTQATQFRAVVNGGTGCSNANSAAATVSITTTTATAGAAITQCGNAAITMTGSSATGVTTLSWTGGTSLGSWSGSGTDPSVYVFTPSVPSGTFTATLTVNGCAFASAIRQITWYATPASPIGTSAARCNTGAISIAAAVQGTGEVIDWYATASGGSALATAQSTYSFASLASTTTYYATARNTTTGCVSASRTAVTATINSLPATPTGSAVISACGVGNTATLSATPPSGCVLDWYAAASGGSILPGGTGTSTFTTPAINVATNYYAEARNSTTGCISASRLTINATIATPPTATAGSNFAQCGYTAIYTSGSSAGGTFTSVGWSGGAALGTWAGSGSDPTTFIFTPSVTSGTFVATLTVYGNFGCNATSTRTFTWSTQPTVTSTTANANCGTGAVLLSATASSGSVIDWFASSTGGTALLAGNNNYTTPSLTTTTTYYVQARNPTTGCLSAPLLPVTATINGSPGITQWRNGNNCGPGSVIISAVPSGGCTVDWYTTATGGTPVATNTLTYTTPSLNTTTTYYAESRVIIGGCVSPSRVAVTATVTTPPAFTPGGGGPYCPGATATFTSSGFGFVSQTWSGPNGFASTAANPSITNLSAANAGTYTIQGYSLSNVNLVYNGDFELGTIGFTSDYTYSPGNLYPEGVYEVLANPQSSHASFSACANHTSGGTKQMVVNGSTVAGVTIWSQTVNVDPNTDFQFSYWETSVYTTNPSQLQLYVNGVPVGAIYTASSTTCQWGQFFYNWNSGSSTTAVLSLVNQNTIANGNDFSLDDIVFQPICVRGSSLSITVALPASPTGVTPGSRCGTGSVNLSATAPSQMTIDWYAGASGGTVVTGGSGAPAFATPSISSNTLYYAETRNSFGGGCVSNSRVSALATVNQLPTITASTGGNVCASGTAALSATPSSGATIDWYAGSSGGTALTSGSNSYNPPSTSSTVTYYAESRNTTTGCLSSPRTGVALTVAPAPTASASTNLGQCGTAAITMTSAIAGGTFGTVSWAGGTGSGTWSGSGTNPATYVFTPSAASGSITATLTVSGTGTCAGTNATSTRTLAWDVAPTAVSVTGGGNVCGSTTLNASGGTGGTIYWQNTTTGGTSTATASASQPVSASGTYFFRAQSPNGCWSTQGSASVTVTTPPSATINYAGSGVCKSAGGSISVTQSGSSGGSYAGSPSTGFSINSSSGAINVASTTAGVYTVTYTMAATGACPAQTATTSVTIAGTVGTPSTPTGGATACQGITGASYSTSATYATGYTWSINGTGNSVTGSTSSVSVNFGASYTGNATLSVQATGCGGPSAAVTKTITVNPTGTWLATSNAWSDANNWCGGVPTSTTNIIVPTGALFMPQTDVDAYVNNLTLQSGTSLTVLSGKALYLSGTISGAGSFIPQVGSTIGYASASPQAIIPTDYSNLTTSGGAKTFSGITRISGTFNPGASSHTVTGSTIEFNGSSAQNIPAFTFDNLTISGNNTKSLTGDVTVGTALTLTNGTLGLASSKLVLNGTISGAGNLGGTCSSELQVAGSSNTGTLNFATGQNTLGKLGMLKTLAGNTYLGNDLNICTQLTLTKGVLILNTYNLTMLSGSTISGGALSSYVQTINHVNPTGAGFLIQELPQNGGARTYPVGINTYTPAYLTNIGSTGFFKVRVFNDIYEFGIAGQTIEHLEVSVKKTWEIAPIAAGGSPDVAIKLEWGVADEGSFFAAARSHANYPYIGKNIGVGSSVWVPQVVSAYNLTTPPFSLTTPSITTFSKFAIGSSMAGLPVRLGNLHVVQDAKTNKLLWETYSEADARGFHVLRSTNGRDYAEIGFVAAAGNSSEKLKYRFVDKNPVGGQLYYKLRLEGTTKADDVNSNVVTVSGATAKEFSVYPNPATDVLNVELSSDEVLDAELRITDAQGKVYPMSLSEGEAGTYRVNVSGLPAGVYVLEKVVGQAVLAKARVVKL